MMFYIRKTRVDGLLNAMTFRNTNKSKKSEKKTRDFKTYALHFFTSISLLISVNTDDFTTQHKVHY